MHAHEQGAPIRRGKGGGEESDPGSRQRLVCNSIMLMIGQHLPYLH